MRTADLPDTPAQPEYATDSTGVILGNADLEATCAWIQTVIPQAPQYTLPGREHLQGADLDLVGGAL